MNRAAGSDVAVVLTDRQEVGSELTDALEAAGYAARVAGGLAHLDPHADLRPLLVIADLALDPTPGDWTELEHHFPDAVVWALIDGGGPVEPARLATVERGCQDYLSYPVDREELGRKLHRLYRWCRSRGGGPDLGEYMSTELELEVPSDRSLVEHVVRFLGARCRDYGRYAPRTLMNFRIALSEALANAILSGNREEVQRKVRIRACIDSSRIEVRVEDEGAGFDPGGIPDPTRPDALESPRGRGLFLLHKLAHEVRFNECGNCVTFVFRSGAAEG